MADSLAARSQRRLSVWAATEPLPAPLPPPPRVREADQPVIIHAELHPAHTAPPDAHITVRDEAAPPSQPQAQSQARTETPSDAVPERSLLSPRVVVSLVISILLLIGLMWSHTRDRTERSWPAVNPIVLGALIESDAPDAELPYITVTPMVPTNGGEPLANGNKSTNPRKQERVRLSDLKMMEPLGADDTQRR
jgi:hypothetical protein